MEQKEQASGEVVAKTTIAAKADVTPAPTPATQKKLKVVIGDFEETVEYDKEGKPNYIMRAKKQNPQ